MSHYPHGYVPGCNDGYVPPHTHHTTVHHGGHIDTYSSPFHHATVVPHVTHHVDHVTHVDHHVDHHHHSGGVIGAVGRALFGHGHHRHHDHHHGSHHDVHYSGTSFR